jgi:sugar transferase (PEP-CTERM/EpsH1 system associated)
VKILFLSQRVPYPPNRGDKITTWRLVERMSRRHAVRVIAFAHDDVDVSAARELTARGIPTTAIRYRDRWKKLGALPLLATSTPLTLGVYGSRALQGEVDRAIGDSDMAYAYSSSMGAFLEPYARIPRVMHFGELDSDKWRQYAERSTFPWSWVYRREARTLLGFERRIAAAFTENVLCTPLEQAIFGERIPGTHSIVLPNGVDLEFFRPTENAPEPGHVVFTGVMNYYPNTDGCEWFVRSILPLVRREFPDARFTIVGAHPTPAVRKLAETPGVHVTGFVNDTREWMRRASISVAPLRIARGIQNKVLEAMAMGLPVVGTTSATQGVGGEPGRDYVVRDDAEGFAEAVKELLRDPPRAKELGRAARRFVESRYDWEVAFQPLDALLDRCEAQLARSR